MVRPSGATAAMEIKISNPAHAPALRAYLEQLDYSVRETGPATLRVEGGPTAVAELRFALASHLELWLSRRPGVTIEMT